MEWLFWIVVCVIFSVIYQRYQIKKRKDYLMKKYGDFKIVERLVKKMFWQGQTTGQLIDSLGKPLDVDQKVMKTKVKEIWKYNSTGKNRYGLRIIIENGEVIGWDKK